LSFFIKGFGEGQEERRGVGNGFGEWVRDGRKGGNYGDER